MSRDEIAVMDGDKRKCGDVELYTCLGDFLDTL